MSIKRKIWPYPNPKLFLLSVFMKLSLKNFSFLPFVCLFYSVYLVVVIKGFKDGSFTPEKQVSTLAGNGEAGFADGTGTDAQFALPTGIAVDSQGNIYVADFDNHRIRLITTKGVVSTLAGKGSPGFADGNSQEAQFNNPAGVAVDSTGNVYVSDQANHCIRKISPAGQVTTLAGNGKTGFSDGNGLSSQFAFPTGIALDKKGNLLVADRDNHRVRLISPRGQVSTLAGTGKAGYSEGKTTTALFNAPNGITADQEGNVYVAEYGGNRIRKISLQGEVRTLAGNGTPGYNDGGYQTSQFNHPSGIAVDRQGNVYVADAGNSCIRMISPTGNVSTLAGTGEAEFCDNLRLRAKFNFPAEVSLTPAGDLLVADANNRRIRLISLR
jgi:sugar lactone lactonase YvrE